MTQTLLRYDSQDGVAVLTIDRPEKRNALSGALCEELRAAWDRFRTSPTDRVAVLTGSGNDAFTAGADLNDLPENFMDALPGVTCDIDKPVIAAVAGHCVGAGVTIVALCDLCVAAENTRFLYPEAKVGVTKGMIAALAARVPHKIAMELMLLGQTVTAQRAYDVGFVNRVVPVGEQVAVAKEMAAAMAGYAPMVLAGLKRLVRQTLPRSPLEVAADAARITDPMLRSADMAEGLAAFRERRPPVFTGR